MTIAFWQIYLKPRLTDANKTVTTILSRLHLNTFTSNALPQKRIITAFKTVLVSVFETTSREESEEYNNKIRKKTNLAGEKIIQTSKVTLC